MDLNENQLKKDDEKIEAHINSVSDEFKITKGGDLNEGSEGKYNDINDTVMELMKNHRNIEDKGLNEDKVNEEYKKLEELKVTEHKERIDKKLNPDEEINRDEKQIGDKEKVTEYKELVEEKLRQEKVGGNLIIEEKVTKEKIEDNLIIEEKGKVIIEKVNIEEDKVGIKTDKLVGIDVPINGIEENEGVIPNFKKKLKDNKDLNEDLDYGISGNLYEDKEKQNKINNEYHSNTNFNDESKIFDIQDNNQKINKKEETGNRTIYNEKYKNRNLEGINRNLEGINRNLEGINRNLEGIETSFQMPKKRGRKRKIDFRQELRSKLDGLLKKRERIINCLSRDQYNVLNPQMIPLRNPSQAIAALLPYNIFSKPTYEDLLFFYSEDHPCLDDEMLETEKMVYETIEKAENLDISLILDILNYKEYKYMHSRLVEYLSSPYFIIRKKCRIKLKIKKKLIVKLPLKNV